MAMLFYLQSTNGFFNNIKVNNKNQYNIRCYLSILSSTSLGKQNICIVGAGFGGLYSALQLDKYFKQHDAHDVNIYIFDPKDKFVFLPLLYELAVGSAAMTEVSPRYEDLLQNTNIQFIQSNVFDIDPTSRSIKYTDVIDDKRVAANNDNNVKTMEYDQCVISVGTLPRVTLIPGAESHAISFYRVSDVYKLQNKLRYLINNNNNNSNVSVSKNNSSISESIKVSVIGGGYSGVEVAANLAEYIKKMNRTAAVSLVDRNAEVMHTSAPHNRLTAQKALLSLGVKTYLNKAVKKIDANSVTLSSVTSANDITSSSDDMTIPSDITVLTTGFEQSPLINQLGLKKDAMGRIYTSSTLQCLGYPNLFALGDCASIQVYAGRDESYLPKTAQVAMQQSDVVAKNVYKRSLLYGSKKYANYKPTSASSSSTTNTAATSNTVAVSTDIHTKRSFPDELDTFRYIPLGEMLSLGDSDAAITGLGGLVTLDGPIASAARRLVYSARMPTNQQKVNAVVNASITTAANFLTRALKRIK